MERLKKQIIQNVVPKKKTDWYEILPNLDFDLLKILKFIKKYNYKKISQKYETEINLIKKVKKPITCSFCKGQGFVLNNFFKEIYKVYKEICKNRPINLPEFDQGSIDEEDVIKRVEFIYERGDLLKSNILVIGDDDLISIALALTKLPNKIYVLEIDKRLVDFISEVSKKYNLRVNALLYDVKNPLIENLTNRFDIFITDPPETLRALKIFLSRGIKSLKKRGAGYFGLTTLESSLNKWFEIEKFIIEEGFVITDIRRKFSVYPLSPKDEEWEFYKDKLEIFQHIGYPKIRNWYYSSFIRIERIKNIKIKNKKYKIDSKKLYLDEESLATPVN